MEMHRKRKTTAQSEPLNIGGREVKHTKLLPVEWEAASLAFFPRTVQHFPWANPGVACREVSRTVPAAFKIQIITYAPASTATANRIDDGTIFHRFLQTSFDAAEVQLFANQSTPGSRPTSTMDSDSTKKAFIRQMQVENNTVNARVLIEV